MKDEIIYLETETDRISIHAICSKLDGIVQPMQLYILIENENGKEFLYNFSKKQCVELMKQMKQAVELVNQFG